MDITGSRWILSFKVIGEDEMRNLRAKSELDKRGPAIMRSEGTHFIKLPLTVAHL